ncbi:MAG: metallopeptidase family protein [Acidimicrobiia bacterium]|nr:metallopeptidase family protein [Acidimicrobiia bacterium]
MRRIEFEHLVDRVIEDLPSWVIDRIENLVVVVEDEPPPESPNLLGLFEGISLAEREDYSGVLPDRIIIYRLPHLEMGLDRPGLEAEVRKTVLHEIAHHLGIDDDRLAELGWD